MENRKNKEVAESFAEEQKKEDHLNTAADNYENSIQLPGLLLDSNSDRLQGNLITWKVSNERLKVGDLVMRAQSRITNLWTFVVTGLAGLIIVGKVVVRAMRKRSP